MTTDPTPTAMSTSVLRRVMTQRGTPLGRLAAAALLGLASSAATIGLLAGSGYLVGRAALRPGLDALVGLLAAVEVLAFLRGPLRYAERLLGHDAALRTLTQWRLWLFDRLARRVPAAFAIWRSGDLLSRAVDDVDTLTDLSLRVLLPVVIALGTAALGTSLVGAILPLAALTLGVPLAVALVVPALVLWRSSAHVAGTPDEGSATSTGAGLAGELSAQVVDVVQGAADLLAFRATGPALARVEELARQVAANDRRQARRAAVATFTIALCQTLAVVGSVVLAVRAVHDHQLGRVMVAVIPLAVLATFEPVPLVAQAMLRARAVQDAASRLLALGDVPVPITDPAAPAVLPPGVPSVAFLRASLRYAPDLPRALDGVTLALPPRSRLALTGSSGSGKSSVISALLRFWPLESGTLEVGGIDVVHLTQHDARALCALADQSAHLFTGTVRSNVALARPEVSDAELRVALDAAQLSEWVAGLPEGLETPVGDDGLAISGGERRRLAVARALVARSPILLLDEPTSALDEPTADRLVTAVLAMATSEGRSVLLVTHRAAEAERCDTVVVLEAGVSVS